MLILLLSLLQFNSTYSSAGTPAPECLNKQGNAMPVMDQQVIDWKASTPNQFQARARVDGVISDIYPDRNGHNHFAIVLDSNPDHNLEVVYNQSFGRIPHLIIGMKIEVCGDYITSDAPTSQYPASPAGAIIHWIHKNPSSHGHKSGYLMINGSLYGQGSGHGGE